MNFKTFSKFFDFLPPEFLHSLFICFLKTQLYKKNNSFTNKDEDDFEFNQDIDFENEIRSPGWLRYQKKLK